MKIKDAFIYLSEHLCMNQLREDYELAAQNGYDIPYSTQMLIDKALNNYADGKGIDVYEDYSSASETAKELLEWWQRLDNDLYIEVFNENGIVKHETNSIEVAQRILARAIKTDCEKFTLYTHKTNEED